MLLTSVPAAGVLPWVVCCVRTIPDLWSLSWKSGLLSKRCAQSAR